MFVLDPKNKEELRKIVSSLVSSMSFKEKKEFFSKVLTKNSVKIPISVFNAKLSSLGIITKYLKEVENVSFSEMEKLINRKPSTLYNTYKNTKDRSKENLDLSDDSTTIPIDIFLNRKYSVLENIVAYLKEEKELSLIRISQLLNKNYNTIKTVYRRYKIKNVR